MGEKNNCNYNNSLFFERGDISALPSRKWGLLLDLVK